MSTPIALITGGSRGLGRAAALALAARGVDIVFTYRGNRAEAARVVADLEARGRKAAALQLDLTRPQDIPAFVESLREKLATHFGRDRILNVSSGLTRFAMAGYAAYASMKAAIETFTRYLAVELGPRRIGVNVIAPGTIATDFGGGAVRDNAELNRAVASNTALGRVGQADDIGSVMAVLLSEQTYWINGQRVEASGGVML